MSRTVLSILLFLAVSLTTGAQVGDLPRSTPEEQGVDSRMLNYLYQRLNALPNVDIHHLMVLRHDKVIGELHATPYRATDLHTLYSASKTVTALAVGLAIDDGLLSIEDKVSKHLRDKMPATLSPALDSLTVRHMLMMAAGREPDLSIPEGEADWLTAWFAGDFSGVGQRFIYDSIMLDMNSVRILHGKGTGALREEIQKYVRTVPGVASAADEHIQFGGSGVTVVKFE